MKKEETKLARIYSRPMVMGHQPIRFETSQSWNRGRGPVSGDDGNSDGDGYPLDPYEPKKD
jgi:hypothetical protein